jgi:hypothetical protein
MSYLFSIFFFFAHFLFAQSYVQKTCAADTARANELFALGEKLQKASKLDSAALCFEQAAERLGENHPDAASSYNNIGFVYYAQCG